MIKWIDDYVPKRTKKSFLWLFNCYREYLEISPMPNDFNDIAVVKLLWFLLESYLESDKK